MGLILTILLCGASLSYEFVTAMAKTVPTNCQRSGGDSATTPTITDTSRVVIGAIAQQVVTSRSIVVGVKTVAPPREAVVTPPSEVEVSDRAVHSRRPS